MSFTHVMTHTHELGSDSVDEVESLLTETLALWAEKEDAGALAAEWYQLSERLCRAGVPVEAILHAVEQRLSPAAIQGTAGKRPTGELQDFVRYYVVRGYEDAIR